MKKRTFIIIVIGGLVLIAALWGASRYLGWFSNKPEVAEITETELPFVYDETSPVDVKNKTKIFDLIILDMSSSMRVIYQPVIDGFNSLLDGMKFASANYSYTQEHYLTLVAFNSTSLSKIYDGVPIDSVNHMTANDYIPKGTTPLYDAIGVSLASMLDAVDTLSNYQVIATIISDGGENSSKFFSKALVARLIDGLSEEGWLFSYMGTDTDIVQQALLLNIDSVHYFDQTDSGLQKALIIDEKSRISIYRAIDSMRRREVSIKK